MPRARKGPPPNELVKLRDALARNLRAHMAANAHTKGLPETSAAIVISRKAGVGKNTILRAISDDVEAADSNDVRLDTLVRMANFFGVSAQDLLRDRNRSGLSIVHKKAKSTARPEGKDSEDQALLHRRRGS